VFRQDVEVIRQAVLSNQHERAAALFNGDIVSHSRALQAGIEADKDYNVKLVNGIAARVLSQADTAIQRNIILGLLGVGIGILVMLMFSWRVTRPVSQLKDAMGDMALGDLDRDIPGIEKADELGDIARALEAIRRSIAERSRAEAEGKLMAQQRITGALERGLAALRQGVWMSGSMKPFRPNMSNCGRTSTPPRPRSLNRFRRFPCRPTRCVRGGRNLLCGARFGASHRGAGSITGSDGQHCA
jgi:HAMP domain-containing protein